MGFYDIPTADLRAFERDLVEGVQGVTIRAARSYAERNGLAFQRFASDCVRLSDSAYVIRADKDPRCAATLAVSIDDLSSPRMPHATAIRRLEGNGTFSSLTVRASGSCAALDEIAEALKAYVEGAYREQTQNLLEASTRLQTRRSDAAYALLRRHLPEQIAESVLLYEVDGEEGRYLLDDVASHSLMSRLRRQRPSRAPRSTLALYKSLATRRLPLANSYSGIALRERQQMFCSLSAAPYAEGCFELAEQVVMGGDAMSTHPIVPEGRIRLLAGCPVHHAEKVADSLRLLAPEFIAICATGWRSGVSLSRLTQIAAHASPYLELKPNFMGIGINLNAWLDWKAGRR